jgi:hypothetical protein
LDTILLVRHVVLGGHIVLVRHDGVQHVLSTPKTN